LQIVQKKIRFSGLKTGLRKDTMRTYIHATGAGSSLPPKTIFIILAEIAPRFKLADSSDG
jgi:hypothetical protein